MSALPEQELLSKLQNQYIIIDSCIWIAAFNHPDTFDPLFLALSSYNCKAVSLPVIGFESLRSIAKEEDYERLEQFMKSRTSPLLASSANANNLEIITTALNIARYYHRNRMNPSFTDCYIAAATAKFSRSPHTVFVLTENHKDFPPHLFTPLKIMPLSIITKTIHKVLTPCIYELDKSKFDSAMNLFSSN